MFGTLSATFPNGLDACSVSTEAKLKESIAVALEDVTGTGYSDTDVTISVSVCSRRLAFERLLTAVPAVVDYSVNVASVSYALQALTAIAVNIAAFVSAFNSRMAFASMALADIVASTLSSSVSFGNFNSMAMSLVETFMGEPGMSVSCSQWRVVGRSVTSEWLVSRLIFFKDRRCALPVDVVPRAEPGGAKKYFNGHAVGGPTRRARASGELLSVFEPSTVEWSSTSPCKDWSDECFLGFHWTSDRVKLHPGADPATFATSERIERVTVEPRCIELVQSEYPGFFAPTLLVQYKTPSGLWQTVLVRAGVEGGRVQLRMPVAT